jgi:hypothetical protein
MKKTKTQVYYDELKGTAAVSGADSPSEAWFAAEIFLCMCVNEWDELVPVIENGHEVREENESGEYVFRVKKIKNNQP